jgi:hypothetical protein
MEMDHIVQAADGGPDTQDNAIPVCFDCHAEIHAYNDRHPKGRKFSAEELRGHRDQWLQICRERPDTLLLAARDTDVGPLQAVINELEFNRVVAKYPNQQDRGCLFKDDQFNRAISQGALWTLTDDLKNLIIEAYAAMGRANQWVSAEVNQEPSAAVAGRNTKQAQNALQDVVAKLQAAYEKLSEFLQIEM